MTYHAVDTDHDRTVEADVNNSETQTGSIPNFADIIVEDGDDIDQAFTDLSEGDTMVVGQPATPYRNDGWLEPGVDGFTIIFQSRFAEDGQPIVKVADGANVGGIRIGNSAKRTGFKIVGYGHDGNEANQDSGNNHGAIRVEDGEDFLIRDVYATRTHPWQVHSDGGNGIHVESGKDYTIRNVHCFEIGDQAVHCEGTNYRVNGILNRQGYDRAFSPGSGTTTSERATISNVIAIGTGDGSAVGFSGGKGITVNNVIGYNLKSGSKAVVRSTTGAEDVTFNNVIAIDAIGALITGGTDININNLKVRDVNNTPSHGVRITDGTVRLSDAEIVYSGNCFRGVTVVGADTTLREGTPHTIENVYSQINDGDAAFYIDTPNVKLDGCESAITGSTSDEVKCNGQPVTIRNHTFNGGGKNSVGSAVINGEAVESASAETPQQSYPEGTLVRFTDSGDGSGTGTYLIDRDGNAVQLSSNV